MVAWALAGGEVAVGRFRQECGGNRPSVAEAVRVERRSDQRVLDRGEQPAGRVGVQEFRAASEMLDNVAFWPAGGQRRSHTRVTGSERGQFLLLLTGQAVRHGDAVSAGAV